MSSTSDNLDLDLVFARGGIPDLPSQAGPDCPSDEALADYVEGTALLGPASLLEEHLLSCASCFGVVRTTARKPAPAPFRVVARLLQRGLELLNEVELSLSPRSAAPALGTLRGGEASDVVSVEGPGAGIDGIELQALANGTARLAVRRADDVGLQSGETAAIILSRDGETRERHPFTEEPAVFAPLSAGRYEVKVFARGSDQGPRLLATAEIDLTA